MALYSIICGEDSETKRVQLGEPERKLYLKGEEIKYRTAQGKEISLGNVEIAYPFYEQKNGRTDMYYTVSGQKYVISE